MSVVVLDASAAVRMVTRMDPVPGVSLAVSQADLVTAPWLFGSEVASALWKYVSHDQLSLFEAMSMMSSALSQVDQVVATDLALLSESLSESCQLNHPVYDMVYAVLARRLGARLATCDRRLARVATSIGVEVVGCEVEAL